MTNREKGIIAKLRKIARSKTQQCYNPGCNNSAIRSHIHQAEGPIRAIASSNGKIVQLEDLDIRFNGKHYAFKEKGIKQKGDVLTFWGFCNDCDTRLFKNIESNEIDYSLRKNQLLFSYRGFLNEHYKQEYNLKWYELIFTSNDLPDELKKEFLSLKIQYIVSVMMGRTTKLQLEEDLFSGSKNHEFIHFTLPRFEVCTSAHYSLPEYIEIENPFRLHLDWLNGQSLPLNTCPIFINLIPDDTKLNVILGCNSDKNLFGYIDLKAIQLFSEREKIKLISDILIVHIETWTVSLALYNTWKKEGTQQKILDEIEKYIPFSMKSFSPEFNMFED